MFDPMGKPEPMPATAPRAMVEDRKEKTAQAEADRVDLIKRFTYHAPKANQPQRYADLRASALKLGGDFLAQCPPGRERALALTKLEEAVFWANASIARNE